MKLRSFVATICLIVAGSVSAAIDTYEFKDDESRERFQSLTQELRCPKCQNQNLADSGSPIALDLRREVYRMVDEGQSNDSIVDFMVARYGEFVLYRPRVSSATNVLWYGPIVMLGLGAVVVLLLVRRRKSSRPTPTAKPDDKAAEERLKKMLADDEKSS